MRQIFVTVSVATIFFVSLTGCQSKSHSTIAEICLNSSEYVWGNSGVVNPLRNIDGIIEYLRQCEDIDYIALNRALDEQDLKGTEYWECTDDGPKVGRLPIEISLLRYYTEEPSDSPAASATVRGHLPGTTSKSFENIGTESYVPDIYFLSNKLRASSQTWFFPTLDLEATAFRFDIDIEESAVWNYIISRGNEGEGKGKGTGIFFAEPISFNNTSVSSLYEFLVNYRQSTAPAAIFNCTSNWFPRNYN